MRYLVSIIREIEVDAWNDEDAKFKAIEIDGRPGEISHVQVERLREPRSAEQCACVDPVKAPWPFCPIHGSEKKMLSSNPSLGTGRIIRDIEHHFRDGADDMLLRRDDWQAIAKEIVRLRDVEGRALETPAIRSAHVEMIPWCYCCEARVSVGHICSCETEAAVKAPAPHEHDFVRMPDSPVGYACECGESPPIGWYPENGPASHT